MIELLTVEEAADLLKLTPYTVRRLLNEGKLPGKKVGGGRQWRINREALERHFTSNSGPETIGDNAFAREPASDAHTMSLMSEAALAQDWLRPDEDEAWAHL
ncbi:MAG TPA: helix-turn-helix domain-containing protein [Chloroflexia bacterium]|nr:helix-turn-helix domain-containing protein [Chloroflexia bacterium]